MLVLFIGIFSKLGTPLLARILSKKDWATKIKSILGKLARNRILKLGKKIGKTNWKTKNKPKRNLLLKEHRGLFKKIKLLLTKWRQFWRIIKKWKKLLQWNNITINFLMNFHHAMNLRKVFLISWGNTSIFGFRNIMICNKLSKVRI